MIRVLFVDDESHILSGLQRMLRPLRHEWAMTFAEGGPAALDALAGAEFDVIVTDMRMPGMSGAQLLAEVRRRHPRVARIVLSGQSDREHLQQLAQTPHEYLSKPCDTELLKETVRRLCGLPGGGRP
ncbi:MAG: response regulator [Armatimonadetes bacterium]|nr:response regulator [Armatimonadota bacterium]